MSDVYSAGLLSYELLAGRAAFLGDDFKKVARKHALERPLNPRIVNRSAKLSSELDRAVMKALEKTIKRRHGSATEFFQTIKGSSEGKDVWSESEEEQPVAAVNAAVDEPVLETMAMGSRFSR